MLSRRRMESVVRAYYDGCNSGDAEKIIGCFEPDAVHYFPAGAPQGTFEGAEAIAAGWKSARQQYGSQWTIDRLFFDAEAKVTVIEWTHWRTRAGVHLRGVEICDFSDGGLIAEIRAYYGAPGSGPDRTHELADFDYAGRDYPVQQPRVLRPADEAGV